MTAGAGMRVVGIADADSFVKWAASLLGSVPDLRAQLLLVRTQLTVSAAQERAALAGTGLSADAVTRLDFDRVREWLEAQRPDVVLLAGRGPFVRLLGRVVDALPHRPVTVSGLPGMAIPAQRGALDYRRHSDLLIVHSHRERRAFAELGARIGVRTPLALATLPFARGRERWGGSRLRESAAAGGLSGGAGGIALAERPVGGTPGAVRRPGATDVVFAAQALVPRRPEERAAIAALLVRAAEADPSRRVVVKLRSRPGEAETHLDRDPYTRLFAGGRPANLVFSHAPMATALESAAGLVTVSSTAAVEALAHGVPVIALDRFGVHKSLLNTVFVGSGLLGGAGEVVAGRFRHPHPSWLRDNYFHPEAESDWWDRVQELVALRRAGALPHRRVPAARGGVFHEAWHRASVLGRADRSLTGGLALAAGVPVTHALSALRASRRRTGQDTWADPTTDYTLEPNPFQDSIRR
ncbi:hypothetical protein CJ226_07850 [Microbacterium sp. UMB0228]|uniref:DUF6716 putative glycosyltransferase n=1 Tax=Microbacterium sp. UMB0228 TaxID=2029109 RepID=UPI000C7FB184|nr:DUF6716 putative glycosyltransferase [Microbacterium sp. UMB0228]PMC03931.1 hypothetical protein CJ226_07850 [Microbacterium sp. UMB0228]